MLKLPAVRPVSVYRRFLRFPRVSQLTGSLVAKGEKGSLRSSHFFRRIPTREPVNRLRLRVHFLLVSTIWQQARVHMYMYVTDIPPIRKPFSQMVLGPSLSHSLITPRSQPCQNVL